MNLKDWLRDNLVDSFGNMSSSKWADIFATGCYKLWVWRNKEIFDQDFVRPTWPVKFNQQEADRYSNLKKLSFGVKLRNCSIRHIKWNFPIEGWWKLNSDGAAKCNPGMAGCGGIICNDRGLFVTGYAYHIGLSNAFSGQLWVFSKG